jgi:hypothetical protein
VLLPLQCCAEYQVLAAGAKRHGSFSSSGSFGSNQQQQQQQPLLISAAGNCGSAWQHQQQYSSSCDSMQLQSPPKLHTTRNGAAAGWPVDSSVKEVAGSDLCEQDSMAWSPSKRA